MVANSLDIYDSWSLDLPLLPERSRLYHLEPIAVGTSCVEGLISYICRLAEAHHVSPGILNKQEILPSLRKTYTIGSREIHEIRRDGDSISVSSFPKPINNRNPNEQGFWAWQYVEGLQPLTLRENLKVLTIPRWTEQAAQSNRKVEIARDLRAWCPECFQQWRTNNQLIYEPLLWSIAAVTVCPIHRKPLQLRCPHCRKTQRPITDVMQVGRCSQCLSWLDVRADRDLEAERLAESEMEWHLRVAEIAMEILKSTPDALPKNVSRKAASVLHDQEASETQVVSCPVKSVQQQFLKVFVY
ncbi:MAG: TniQ family protein [Leptolyngbyaceae cyanobacterium SL_5_14]|nr:TniQ family protein [Leptolyngbyaceae cyanobacterium SL_5_14]